MTPPHEKLAFVAHSCPFVVLSTQMDARRLCRAGVPTRAIHALPSPLSSHLPTFSNGRTAALPCGRAHARHPRTTFSSLLPSPYPTEAHCIVSTHYLLLPPPYSLLFFLFGGKIRRDVYIRRPYTCVAGCAVRYRPSTIIEFVPVPNPMRAGFSRHVLDRLRRWLICHTARHGRD